jgi:hypothetical protein
MKELVIRKSEAFEIVIAIKDSLNRLFRYLGASRAVKDDSGPYKVKTMT